MLKLLVWAAGAGGFSWAIFHFGYWHETAALAVLMAASVWIIGGAVVLSRAMKGARPTLESRAAEVAALKESAARAARARERAEPHT